jgi:endonuclease/exonuclease/phosphatase family metal-dependent hydrolase
MPLSIATWNVKDLFEPSAQRLAYLAWVLGEVDADVLGLQEVGTNRALDALLEAAASLGYRHKVVGTPDKRGIRNALVSRLRLVEGRVHTCDALEFPRFAASDPPPFGARVPLRRGVVHARVEAPGLGEVHALVAHLKSGRALPLEGASGAPVEPRSSRERSEGALRALVWRASEALFVRGLVDQVQATNGEARVVVLGDMNDAWGSLPLRIVAGDGEGALAPCADRVPAEDRWSFIYDGVKAQLDHILASSPLAARLEGARFLNEEVRDHGALPSQAFPTLDSDHAPLVARFA